MRSPGPLTLRDETSAKHGKRERLVAAAVRLLYEQGVEKTTLADIAQAAEIPVGNVYYYFKTKDDIVRAVIAAHSEELRAQIARFDRQPTPRARLNALVRAWIDQGQMAAGYGCPFGSLASELDKRADGLDCDAAKVLGTLIDWAESQFRDMGRPDARDLAVALISAYQGVSLLTNTFRDPDLMKREGLRLERWIESLE